MYSLKMYMIVIIDGVNDVTYVCNSGDTHSGGHDQFLVTWRYQLKNSDMIC